MRARAPAVVLCLLTSPLELPCHARLVKVGSGAPGRETRRRRGDNQATERFVGSRCFGDRQRGKDTFSELRHTISPVNSPEEAEPAGGVLDPTDERRRVRRKPLR